MSHKAAEEIMAGATWLLLVGRETNKGFFISLLSPPLVS